MPLKIRAVFPGTKIEIKMVERSPALGTEEKPPSDMICDARTGEFWQV